MVMLTVLGVLAVLMSTGVDCGYSSASSGAGSASDGSGHTFSASNNNGQGQFTQTQTKPGGISVPQSGNISPTNQYYGPANIGQPGFGLNYGPGFPYSPFGTNTPAYIPQPSYGFNSPFQPYQPLQPFQPLQPMQPFQPFPSLATPQEFTAFLNGIQQQYIAGGTTAQSTPGATAFASSYLGPTKYYKQQQDLLNAWKNTPFTAGYGGVPNYAYATGAFGPNGIQQTAGVFPPNKVKPNLDSRIDPSESTAGNSPTGFFGIQTSSFSSSSDVNGIKKHKEGATTTINDNGKVSSYTLEN